jgi:hypothetical protein
MVMEHVGNSIERIAINGIPHLSMPPEVVAASK